MAERFRFHFRLLEKMRLDRRHSLGKLTKLWLVLRGWLGALVQ